MEKISIDDMINDLPNGSYINRCWDCEKLFHGKKYQRICYECQIKELKKQLKEVRSLL